MDRFYLWRGNELLGWFVEREPVTRFGRRVGVAGILQPSVPSARLSSLMQVRWPEELMPVTQYSLKTIWLGADIPRGDPPGSGSTEEPWDEVSRISEEDLLEIRAEDGSTIQATLISIQLCAIPDDIDPAPVYEANNFVGDSREIWMVNYSAQEW